MSKLTKVLIIVALVLMSLFLLVEMAHAADWDKSSLAVTGQCLTGGILRVTITNNGADMAGPTDYEFTYTVTMPSHTGALQLAHDESIIIDSYPAPNTKITFIVQQRPGHPGIGEATAVMSCSPNYVKVGGLSAGPLVPDRNGIFGDTPLRNDLELLAVAIMFGIVLWVVIRTFAK